MNLEALEKERPAETVPAARRIGTASPSEVPHAIVCDADEVSARMLTRAVAGAGFRVSVAATAAACETLVSVDPPQLVVLAILLPDRDGLSLTRDLRTKHPTLRVLVFSALQAERRALEAGATAFLLKPVSNRRLLTAIQTLRSLAVAA